MKKWMVMIGIFLGIASVFSQAKVRIEYLIDISDTCNNVSIYFGDVVVTDRAGEIIVNEGSISQIIVRGSHYNYSGINCFEGEYKVDLGYDYISKDKTYYIDSSGHGASIALRITPIYDITFGDYPIQLPDQIETSRIVCEDEILDISATPNFHESTYEWYFYDIINPDVGSEGTWRLLHHKFGSTIQLQLSDLYANEEDQVKTFGKTIRVSLKPGDMDENVAYSKAVEIDFRPSPPKVLDIAYKKLDCHDSELEGVSLYFNRRLKSSEKVFISIHRKNLVSNSYNGEAPSHQFSLEGTSTLIESTYSNTTMYKYTIPGQEVNGLEEFLIKVFTEQIGSETYAKNIITSCQSFSKTFQISRPEAIKVEKKVYKQSCYGKDSGSVVLAAIGGSSGKFYYDIDASENWIVFDTNSNSESITCTTTISGLSVGQHQIRVKDANGCLYDEGNTLPITINEATEITHTASIVQHPGAPNETDGSIAVKVIGGEEQNSYEYKILSGTTSQIISQGTIEKDVSITLENLPSGTHTVVYTDDNECAKELTLPTLEDPEAITVTLTTQQLNCASTQSILVEDLSGGYSPYHIEVKDTSGEVKANVTVQDTESNEYVIPNIDEGTYIVTITDSRKGIFIKKVTLAHTEPLGIEVVKGDEKICQSHLEGEATVRASGGSGNYEFGYKSAGGQYFWVKTYNSYSYNFRFSSPNTAYSFAIRDINYPDCIKESHVTYSFIRIAPPTINSNVTHNENYFGEKNGSIQLTIIGGDESPYDITWKKQGDPSFNKSGDEITELSAGVYIANILGRYCTYARRIEVKSPSKLQGEITAAEAILCNDGTTNLIINSSGGVGSHTYQWYKDEQAINGATSKQLKDIDKGIYKVEITDSYTSTIVTKEITAPSELQLSIDNIQDAICHYTKGQVILKPSGGSGTYFYSIDNKNTYKPLSNLPTTTVDVYKGDYIFWLKDGNGCELKNGVSVTVGAPDALVINTVSLVHNEISGESEGSISVEILGAVNSLTYLWTKKGDISFSRTTKNIDHLPAGVYTFLATNTLGCQFTKTYEIKEPLPLKVQLNIAEIIHCKDDVGKLTANVTGGMPIVSTASDFEYKWYKIESSNEELLAEGKGVYFLNDLSSGTYKVVAIDIKGVEATTQITLDEPEKLVATIDAVVDVDCFDASTGKISLLVSGGEPPYQYSWTELNGQVTTSTSPVLEDIKAGTYNVEITDNRSCSVLIKDIVVHQPLQALTIDSETIVHLKGYQTNDGSIEVTVSGGTPGYTYQWKNVSTSAIISNTKKVANLTIGEYQVTITDTKGCLLTQTYTVEQPELLSIESITQQGTVLCNGDTTVTLTAVVTGGIKPYTYGWYKEGVKISEDVVLKSVTGGNYMLKIIDSNTISTTRTYQIQQPDKLDVVATTQRNLKCYGAEDGVLEVEVSGGKSPYTYSWNNGATTSRLENIAAGIYKVTIIDDNLCKITKEFKIEQPDNNMSIDVVKITHVTGYGLSNGSIEVLAKGGTSSYTYQWEDETSTQLPETSHKLSSLPAGTYFVTAIDANGCKLKSQGVIVKEPSPIEITIDKTEISCYGEKGSLQAVVKGGVMPYAYYWHEVGSTVTVSTEEKLADVKAGVYELVVTDTNDNTTTVSNIRLNQPDLLQINNSQVTNVTCYNGADGAIKVTVSGGTAPYQYIWSNGASTSEVTGLLSGQYTVTIKDNKGCSISKGITISQPSKYDVSEIKMIRPSEDDNDGSITIAIEGGVAPYHYQFTNKDGNSLLDVSKSERSFEVLNLSSGMYHLLITDTIGCQISKTYNLSNPGELLVAIKQVQDIKCHGGTGILDVEVIGVGGNTYTWYQADTHKIVGTERMLKNIQEGSYYIVVKNAFGMSEQSAPFEVTAPKAIELVVDAEDVKCYGAAGGVISFTATGGSGKYTYRYRKVGETYSSWQEASEGVNKIIPNLFAGTYSIQLQDTNFCSYQNNLGEDEIVQTIEQPEEFKIDSEEITPISVYGFSDGYIQVLVSGGKEPYSYQWSDGSDNVIGTKNNIIDVSSGTYTLIITDANGCIIEKEYQLDDPIKIEVDISLLDVIHCKGGNDGALKVVSKNEIPDIFTCYWFKKGIIEPIGRGIEIRNLGEGTYYAEIKYNDTIVFTSEEYILQDPALLEVSYTSDYKSCGEGDNWTISLNVTGGTKPYRYLWDTGSNNAELSGVSLGSYKATVVDARGCERTIDIQLTPPQPITITESVSAPICANAANGTISVQAKGGTPPYTYKWSNGKTGKEIQGVAGTYEVTATGINGCSYTKSIIIPEKEALQLDLGENITLCQGQTYIFDASINEEATYQWSSTNGFTSTDNLIEVSESGIYTVVVTNKYGCQVTDQVEVQKISTLLRAEFMISSEIFSDESFIAVNISNSASDNVIWSLPDEAKIIEKDTNYCEAKIEKEGDYQITLYTSKDGCEAYQTKTIRVVSRDVSTSDELSLRGSIYNFKVYPNPSSGHFSTDISLAQKSPIQIKMYSFSNGSLIFDEKYNGQSHYHLSYDLNLPTGLYFVVVTSNGIKKVKKVVIE